MSTLSMQPPVTSHLLHPDIPLSEAIWSQEPQVMNCVD
jgi:hypothetical protein